VLGLQAIPWQIAHSDTSKILLSAQTKARGISTFEDIQIPESLCIQPIHLHPWLDDTDSNPDTILP